MSEATLIHARTIEAMEAVAAGLPWPETPFIVEFATNGPRTISPALTSRFAA